MHSAVGLFRSDRRDTPGRQHAVLENTAEVGILAGSPSLLRGAPASHSTINEPDRMHKARSASEETALFPRWRFGLLLG